MIIKTDVNGKDLENGSELLELIDVPEEEAVARYSPVTHALVIVKCGERYLMGYNNRRRRWEIFGGCREEGEALRECMVRETREELGIADAPVTYLGLMHANMAPSFFNNYKWSEEYGGLYGLTVSEDTLPAIMALYEDREEIGGFKFYDEVAGCETVAQIDEALLQFY